jgi:LmbE family N-acetylglucosaminyl deacetylase
MKGFRHHKLVNRKPLYVSGIILLVSIAALGVFLLKPKKIDPTVIIVLSPHYDDAVLSLGGLLAKHVHPAVVATFFTALPTQATSTPWDARSGFSSSNDAIPARIQENTQALRMLGAEIKDFGYQDYQYRQHASSTEAELQQEIAQDIQALVASYGDKNVEVYAPSIFLPDITHPDHALLHRAFKDVAEQYPKKNITFYYYEDYPYVQAFTKESNISLEKNLENDTGRIFDEIHISLSSEEVSQKQSSLEKYASQSKAFTAENVDIVKNTTAYTNSRCGNEGPCEVVYRLFRVID